MPEDEEGLGEFDEIDSGDGPRKEDLLCIAMAFMAILDTGSGRAFRLWVSGLSKSRKSCFMYMEEMLVSTPDMHAPCLGQ